MCESENIPKIKAGHFPTWMRVALDQLKHVRSDENSPEHKRNSAEYHRNSETFAREIRGYVQKFAREIEVRMGGLVDNAYERVHEIQGVVDGLYGVLGEMDRVTVEHADRLEKLAVQFKLHEESLLGVPTQRPSLFYE